MAAEVYFYPRDTKSEKKTGVYLYFSYPLHRKLFIGTVEKIDPKYWNEITQRARTKKEATTTNKEYLSDFADFNKVLNDFQEKAIEVYNAYLKTYAQEQPAPEKIKELIHAQIFEQTKPVVIPKHFNLISYLDFYINQIKTGKRLSKTGKPLSNSVLKIHKTHLAVLKEYQQTLRKSIAFEDVTLDFYLDFKEFLIKTRKYSLNTVGKHIRTLKGVLNEATETGVNKSLHFKSRRFIAPTENVDNVYLTPAELETLYNFDFSENKRLERVRDLFLVGCWTGLRFSDFSTISPKNIKDDFIVITTQKTGREVVIPIHPTVKAIMERYDGLTENGLPPAISNQKMNDYLKDMGKEAELMETVQKERTKAGAKLITNQPKFERITTHTARRSFATNMYNLSVPTLTIMNITGHKTETSFMKYIKVTPMEHAHKLKEIWQKSFLKAV